MEKSYYINKEQFNAVKSSWKNQKHHESWEHILYNVLRSKPADNGFTLRTKNIQGNHPWYAFNHALSVALGNLKYRKQSADELFGFELPEDLHAQLCPLKKPLSEKSLGVSQ